MQSKKRRRFDRTTIHPRNRYAEKPPDFTLLASLYPSFSPYVIASSAGGRPTIVWTDYNATRELTRVLLLHDHGLNWWIPDGQLCPTVPNRLNYIHWIEDLLASELIPAKPSSDGKVRGFDIGTGANCIYPLLGSSLLGWSFIGSDVTDVGLEWSRKNVESNPHISDLIEIRNANHASCTGEVGLNSLETTANGDSKPSVGGETGLSSSKSDMDRCSGPCVLVGLVKDGEKFDFCMCNPPFFESIEEAGRNPKTACGGTTEEMVCSGGERTFIARIIDDSASLKDSFRWFTSMVGRKANLKFLMSKLREIGVSIVKTTEFVQGQTARWGLAWSFVPPNKIYAVSNVPTKSHHSFTLEGLKRQFGAFQILKSIESFFQATGAICKADASLFHVNITLSNDHLNEKTEDNITDTDGNADSQTSSGAKNSKFSNELSFRVSVFEQIPGTLLIKGSLLDKDGQFSGQFISLFSQLEDALKTNFLKKGHEN